MSRSVLFLSQAPATHQPSNLPHRSATRDHVVDPGEDTPNRLLYSLTNSTLMSETSVIVRESDYDVDSGIDISPGQWATIKVSGQIYSGWWWAPPNGPEGWDSIQDSYDYPLPGSRPYSLVGKLGTSYFYIGRSNASIDNPFQTQRLYLRINDDVPGNGYGEFYCRVQVWRKLPSAEATFVFQAAPTVMTPGQTASVTVTMQNTGETAWTAAEGYQLGSQNPQDNLRWGINRVALPHSVPPGSQVTFTFTVPAPGIAGNYSFQWPMVQDGVEWFGDYTPNLIVFVRDPL